MGINFEIEKVDIMQSMFNNINRAREVLQGQIVNTPTLKLNEDDIQEILPHNADVSIKLELFQQTGSFKARGVAIGLETLEEDKKAQGIVTRHGRKSWHSYRLGCKSIQYFGKNYYAKDCRPI